jgi:uncharacterized protein YlxP (DUF503 family)
MIVAAITWQLEIYGAQSLKDKRRVVKSLKDRLHDRFNVSAAETAYQDVWQRAELSACVVSGERAHADSVIDSADRLVNGEARARVIRTERSYY